MADAGTQIHWSLEATAKTKTLSTLARWRAIVTTYFRDFAFWLFRAYGTIGRPAMTYVDAAGAGPSRRTDFR